MDEKLTITSQCIHALTGHSSTIRCIKVLDRLPVAVTGSRDSTIRVWDIQKGQLKHTLRGHAGSIRCMDVAGNLCVSGSYDNSARVSHNFLLYKKEWYFLVTFVINEETQRHENTNS